MSESADIPSSSSSHAAGQFGPLGAVQAVMDHVPGAGLVKEAVNGTLDVVGSVSPRARRVAVYAGVGILGAAGLVEWPVAAAGAAVVWLTQQRPRSNSEAGEAPTGQRQDSPTIASTAPKRVKGTPKTSSSPANGRRNGPVPIDAGAPSGQKAG
ncbi:hypothetical protein [Streptomyces orinoci]|uniref:Uncharacterized protein n=1 Tax=Streptomyces orinoci TaxID=67339 RepID=A0ABV3K4B5_STRON|nr:hypothetical protein [Streptomyces orinoci]